MRDHLKQVLMACVGVLALLVLFGRNTTVVYVLLPALPLLAALYAMHWVRGSAYVWWYRFALSWTAASMLATVITPSAAKPVVGTLAALVLSTITLAVLVQRVVIPHYRIARAIPD